MECINDFILEISKIYNIDKEEVKNIWTNINYKKCKECKDLGSEIFVEMINIQKQKEEDSNIWNYSAYKNLIKLQSNNVGIVGETFMKKICDINEIEAYVYGSKIKNKADGLILDKSVEIKTSHRGCSGDSFQHELGISPWKANFIIFIDVAQTCIYITIFKNFSEEFYKSGKKCPQYFPTKSITWRNRKEEFKGEELFKENP